MAFERKVDLVVNIARQHQQTDGSLLLACRQGDAAAWEALVERYQRLIYAIPRRCELDDDQCSEVFQVTFTRLLENLDRIQQPERIRAWLVTTARRETLRLLRQNGRLQAFTDLHDDGFHSHTSQCDQTNDSDIEILEEQHLVRTALMAMDDRCQRLLTLMFFQPSPMSYEDIAREIGTTPGSLGPTRARCLQKLRYLLEQVEA
jgi:RNA polymerase sigma factor (sigma-70 family)